MFSFSLLKTMGQDKVLIIIYLRTLQLAHGNSLLPPAVRRCLVLCPDRAWELAGTQGSCTVGSWDSPEYTMP